MFDLGAASDDRDRDADRGPGSRRALDADRTAVILDDPPRHRHTQTRARLAHRLQIRLTLRELEALTGLGLAVLLTLHHAAVAGKEAALFQNTAQFGFEIGQRL